MQMKKDFGYVRVGTAVPELKIANPNYNVKNIFTIMKKAYKENIKVLVFPELCITAYTCGDLFNQSLLINKAEEALKNLLVLTSDINMVTAVGMPVRVDNQLFNCAVIINRGNILGVVPKTFIPNYNEFYEKRNFASAVSRISDEALLCGKKVPFGENLLFKDINSKLCIGIEVCEDLWVNIPPSSYHTLNGANLILNLSASDENVSKSDYRRDIVRLQSAKCITAYAYASAGQTESTSDLVFSGHSIIADNGKVLKEMKFNDASYVEYQDIDIEKLMNDRIKFNSYMGRIEKREYRTINFYLGYSEEISLKRHVEAMPFVPLDKNKRDIRCSEIINLQALGLYQRLKKIGINKVVIGVSGGLDSTLALLVIVETFKKLKAPMTNIIGVTMPGFGTTNRTYNNAITLMKKLGITIKEISIKEACIRHFKDIGQDLNVKDITYENSQARERTQILMDLANKEGGIVVGTGDLSELALGWCTYNGDQMSMYSVNGSIPKTLVRYLVMWYAKWAEDKEVKNILVDIYDTPVSPELLPPDKKGNIKQKTEDSIGSYELNDFFLYNMLRTGYEPLKILYLASIAFKGRYSENVIHSSLKNFYKRFFTQQFKRNCMPDGVKVGSVSLSPRGDLRMPSDASYELWLDELEKSNEIKC
ncbi:NAD(+) synthase [Clostridium felsineum]|uniref:NAD(+) synthase n=1 Tax=Clostridium felsineum TaxID=36839 RepID=UPI00098C929A|nr:NAD(+) synthase [Clostridium felsineum]